MEMVLAASGVDSAGCAGVVSVSGKSAESSSGVFSETESCGVTSEAKSGVREDAARLRLRKPDKIMRLICWEICLRIIDYLLIIVLFILAQSARRLQPSYPVSRNGRLDF